MAATLPILPQSDIEQAAFIIQNAYIPGQDVETSRRAQHELFELQKRTEAWGLIVPLLDHPDPNVQFFGAHTAQVKIARDWDSFPQDHVIDLRNALLEIAGRSVAAGKNKVTLRKLFVAITSLALKLVPGRPTKWPDWILHVVTSLSGTGARGEYILEFMEIAAEEVGSSDLVSTSKAQIQHSLREATPIVTQAISSTLTSPSSTESERHAAFKCLEAWISQLNGDELTAFIPVLIGLLSNESTFVGASDVLQEILSSSPLSDGAGTKILTEPLLTYLEQSGALIVKQTVESADVDEISHSLCKLLVALGEHSINFFATKLSTPRVQNFISLLATYTALPGYYGVDEDESEMTLSFWYLLQESLWSVDYSSQPDAAEAALDEWAESLGASTQKSAEEEDQGALSHSAAVPIYQALVHVLKRKVTWPPKSVLSSWTKDQREKFNAYRRDVGDTLINAYYILRQDLLKPLVDELVQELVSRNPRAGWENVEAILHCIMSVQEAVELMSNPHIERLFGPEILGRLPSTGHDRVRRTTLVLIGTYATWFTVSIDERFLLGALNYVVGALDEPTLCLQAANALRDLCDSNRQKLAKHIASFGQLHARLPAIPDSEKTKVIQSISSVIQALPPEEEVEPVDVIISPVVAKLAEALTSAGQLPEDARNLAILQLQTLTGCAKGLTRTSDVLFAFDENSQEKAEFERMQRARDDPRMVRLRDAIIQGIRGVMALWSGDATTADTLSNLIVAITSLPSDMTLISLPPGPLLHLVCAALQQQLNAVWLTQAKKLISQLDPPSFTSLLAVPTEEANATVLTALPIILDVSLSFLGENGAMENVNNPDIVQDFFSCMEMVAQHFAPLLFRLPPAALDALLQCTVRALTLQERYSLVAACTFIVRFINRTIAVETLSEQGKAVIRAHGRSILHAILCGIAGASPSSTSQNLVDLLVVLVQRCTEECRVWVPEVLFAVDFFPTKASKEDKERFAKAILVSRSTKRTREAASQFAIVAKGLSGTSFGYAGR